MSIVAGSDTLKPRKLRIRIFRGVVDASGGRSGYQDYFETIDDQTTVLDAIERIRTDQEPDLLYRHSCHHGSCGTCAVMVNGRPKLMCLTRLRSVVDELPDGRIAESDRDRAEERRGEDDVVVIDPLAGFPHVRDLVVQQNGMFSAFPENGDYSRRSDVNSDVAPPKEIERFERFENCIECGCCVAACPVATRFAGPAALAAASREIANHPERTDEILSTVDSAEGVFGCERALNCSRVCPTGVYPSKEIFLLRASVERTHAGGRE